jgi:hypothetical protein
MVFHDQKRKIQVVSSMKTTANGVGRTIIFEKNFLTNTPSYDELGFGHRSSISYLLPLTIAYCSRPTSLKNQLMYKVSIQNSNGILHCCAEHLCMENNFGGCNSFSNNSNGFLLSPPIKVHFLIYCCGFN